ncbi:MAG: adenylate kinase family protein [Candidatus Woesearchaeota archaeon]
MIINLQGIQGSGKGTQAKHLIDDFGLIYIESGGRFRRDLKENREVGLLAKEYMAKGELVPDYVLFKGLETWIEESDPTGNSAGLVLDGIPRTIDQAANFADYCVNKGMLVPIRYVLVLNCSPDTARKRIYGRLYDEEGNLYNSYFDDRIVVLEKNAVNGYDISLKATLDGKVLTKRPDDADVNTVERRISIYLDETIPAIDYMRGEKVKGRMWNHGPLPVVIDIDGEASTDKVREQILHSRLYRM